MACYILSNNNRFYAAIEENYGSIPEISEEHRIPAIRLAADQRTVRVERRDKTGSRTFAGYPAGLRRQTAFHLRTYLTSWTDHEREPLHGALIRSCLGGDAMTHQGGIVAQSSGGRTIECAAPHGLVPGQAVAFGGEMRFVEALVDDHTFQLNAPFTFEPTPGSPLGTTTTYSLSSRLGSVSVFDYWSPAESVQRILRGASVDRMTVRVNGDFHEFDFSGPAADLIDNTSFESGQAGLTSFPAEPPVTQLDYSLIPGHLGQVWLGTSPDRFFTLTEGELQIDNNIDARNREFGFTGTRCIVPGPRSVTLNFALYGQDSEATKALYQAARQRSPISAMLQLGEQSGQLFGIYMKSIVPEVPVFDDSDNRLQWRFSGCRAQGWSDDELFFAFG
ncbi:MAG: hypothetical protein ACK5AZ_11655 [Bryobacteraceae bacterium]